MITLTYWEKLPHESRPIVMYGTGNGADKILDACAHYGIKVDAVFASNGFVRNRTFRDMPVLSYEDVRERFGDNIVILPAFGTTIPEVMDFFAVLDSRHDVIIPEVPLYGGGIFDADYLEEHYSDLKAVYNMLSDEYSKELFKDTILFRITGKLKYLNRCESMCTTMSSIQKMNSVVTALDGGAFKGDSASDMLAALPNVKHIIACEPDPSTYKKLCAFADTDDVMGRVIPVEAALSDKIGVSQCVSSGSRGSGISGKNRRAKIKEIKLDTIDSIIGEGRVDYIKLDVEGCELEAINGGYRTICNLRPIVSVSLYHRTGDIFTLPKVLAKMIGPCEMYLRRPKCIPMWDLNMYMVPLDVNN